MSQVVAPASVEKPFPGTAADMGSVARKGGVRRWKQGMEAPLEASMTSALWEQVENLEPPMEHLPDLRFVDTKRYLSAKIQQPPPPPMYRQRHSHFLFCSEQKKSHQDLNKKSHVPRYSPLASHKTIVNAFPKRNSSHPSTNTHIHTKRRQCGVIMTGRTSQQKRGPLSPSSWTIKEAHCCQSLVCAHVHTNFLNA